MTPWRIGAAWVAVLVLTTMLTWQIVSFADSQVSARPVEVAVSSSTLADGPTTTTTPLVTSSTSSSPTTSQPSSSGPTTSQPASSTTSPSSTVVSSWSVRSVTTAGGTVVIRYRPEEVELQAATPAPGFDVELKDSGPQLVRVEFEAEESDVRVEARWHDGELDVTVSDD